MNGELPSLPECLETMIGTYCTIKIFGYDLDPKEGTGGFLKEIILDEDDIVLDYTGQEDFMQLKIGGIESYFEQGVELSVFANSVELEWCFAPRENWGKEGISTWQMEKVRGSTEGDIIKSIKHTAWNNKEDKRELLTRAPALKLRCRP